MSNLEFAPLERETGAKRSCGAKAWVVSVSVGTFASVIAFIALAVNQGELQKSVTILNSDSSASRSNPPKLLNCGDGVVVREMATCDSGDLKCNCPPAVNEMCPKPPEGLTVIPDVKRLTLGEKKAIIAGVYKMKEVKSQYDEAYNAWDYFVITHQKATLPASEVHAGWWFYPWHREFMRRFNEELRRVTGDPKITFAYWNWADPDSSEAMFGLDYMGPQAGLQQHQYVVNEGNFRQGKWKITKELQFLNQEKSSGSLIRAPGNGLQMCFDQDQNSYFLDTAENHPDIDHRDIVGPFHYLGVQGAPPASVAADTDVFMKPRRDNLVSCDANSWTKLKCDRFYDAVPNSSVSRKVKTLRCQHYAATLPTNADYDRCSKLPGYTTMDKDKLGTNDPENKFNGWATTKDYYNSYEDHFRACFEGIDPSDVLAKGLERVGASLHPPHGATHTYSGGSMATPNSPNDPLFTGLHWNVDRKFAEWQIKYGNKWFTEGPMKDMLDKNMPVFENPPATLRSVLNLKELGYTFDSIC